MSRSPQTPPKLFIGVPAYGDMSPAFVQSLFALASQTKVPLELRMVTGCSLITKARNILSADFLETDCTHLLFLDSDLNRFTADHVSALLAHQVSVVGGRYCKKQEGEPAWLYRDYPGLAKSAAEGLRRVRGVGTGFLLIERRVFVKMAQEQSHFSRYTADSGREEYDFFSAGPYTEPDGRRVYLGEDYTFCQRCLDMGVPVYLDPQVTLYHRGPADYPRPSAQS